MSNKNKKYNEPKHATVADISPVYDHVDAPKTSKKKIFWIVLGIIIALGFAVILTSKPDTATPVAPRPELAQVADEAPTVDTVEAEAPVVEDAAV